MTTRLTDTELRRLIRVLYAHGRILRTWVPDMFDSTSIEDAIQDALCDLQTGNLKFDPARGKSLDTFLKTVVTNKVRDRVRRARRAISFSDWLPPRSNRIQKAPARSQDATAAELVTAVRRLAQEDSEVKALLQAIEDLDGVPSNVDQRLSEHSGLDIGLIRNIKRRLPVSIEECKFAADSSSRV